MGAIAAWAAKWFFGGGLTKLGQIGVDLYRTKLDAENTTEAKVADLASRSLALDQREAEINASVVVAEQGNWATRWVRPMWAAPFVIWTWKVVVWDAVLNMGTTPDLKGTPATLASIIAVSYFGSRGLEKLIDRWHATRSTITGKR